MTTLIDAPPRTCRILYYGPAESGKSANLARIRASVPNGYRVAGPREPRRESLGFQLDAGALGSWSVLVEAADPPGAGRGRSVAPGEFPFDGIVFVADSSADKLDDNLSSLEALKIHLERSGLDIASLPMVIQYNKQDAPGSLPLADLESLLNPWGLPAFPAVATSGKGVRETLKAALGLTLRQLTREGDEPEAPRDEEEPPALRESALDVAPARRPEQPRDLKPEAGAAPVVVTGLQIESDDGSELIFKSRCQPLVVPVRLPRSLVDARGSVRIVLDIQIVDGDLPVLG